MKVFFNFGVFLIFFCYFFLGDFLDDNKEGIGTIFLSNGDKFTGNFENDFVHGSGTF